MCVMFAMAFTVRETHDASWLHVDPGNKSRNATACHHPVQNKAPQAHSSKQKEKLFKLMVVRTT